MPAIKRSSGEPILHGLSLLQPSSIYTSLPSQAACGMRVTCDLGLARRDEDEAWCRERRRDETETRHGVGSAGDEQPMISRFTAVARCLGASACDTGNILS
jgi:hypothetical protein